MKMRFSTKIIFCLLSFYSHHAQAKPVAQFDPPPCLDFTDYTKTEEKDVAGPQQQLPVSCTPSGGESCTVGSATSYTVSITVTVGLDLGLNLGEIGSLGASVSLSKTEANGVTDSAGTGCKGPWTCSIIVSPTMVEISGEQKDSTTCTNDVTSKPYTVQFPKLGEDKNPVQNVEACACPNREHWADPGAPKKCLEDCAL